MKRTFHVNPPPNCALPLLPRARNAPQTAVAVDGTLRCVKRGRVNGLQRGRRCAREECMDVVNLLVRLRQGDEVQPARPYTVSAEESG